MAAPLPAHSSSIRLHPPHIHFGLPRRVPDPRRLLFRPAHRGTRWRTRPLGHRLVQSRVIRSRARRNDFRSSCNPRGGRRHAHPRPTANSIARSDQYPRQCLARMERRTATSSDSPNPGSSATILSSYASAVSRANPESLPPELRAAQAAGETLVTAPPERVETILPTSLRDDLSADWTTWPGRAVPFTR